MHAAWAMTAPVAIVSGVSLTLVMAVLTLVKLSIMVVALASYRREDESAG